MGSINILIPMAGMGSRFTDAGYDIPKALLPVTSRRTGLMLPMVVAAAKDLPVPPGFKPRYHFILRSDDLYREAGEDAILLHFPDAIFIHVPVLTEGQASTCLVAKEYIDNDMPLLIGACDNGMELDGELFSKSASEADALVFTFRGHAVVTTKPEAYGWVVADGTHVQRMSVKIPVSEKLLGDHAVVGTFWFRKGSDFVRAAEQMISKNDRINNEFYVDQAIQHLLMLTPKVNTFEITRYLGWGMPSDYENYHSTLQYWRDFYVENVGGNP